MNTKVDSAAQRTVPVIRPVAARRSTPLAGTLAWLVPGLGHWYLGRRQQAIVLFVTIVVTFWGGVALGGVRSTVNIQENGAWFAAQLCAGAQTIGALMWSKKVPPQMRYEAAYPTSDVAVIYTSIAGLLNLLVIIDALALAEAGRVSRFARPPPGAGAGR